MSFRRHWFRFNDYLGTPVDGASLAVFRIAVGLVMALEAFALWRPNPAAISVGTSPIETYYAGPDITFHFPYEGFEWLPLLPAPLIHALVGIMAFAGVCMALGLWYRFSVTTVFLTWAYLFLVESTRTYWQSHYYLELLVVFLLVWMPAARRYSVDAWLRPHGHPAQIVPLWSLVLLRGQLVIAYFYAGVAKLNVDWLLDAVPVRWFLTNPDVTVPYEPYLTAGQIGCVKGILHNAGFAYFISYAGLTFDLAIGFLLLIRRTRIFGLMLMVVFHATNHFVIFDDISWFPLLGVTTALIFLDADWPERFWKWMRRPRLVKPDWNWFAVGAILFPLVGASLGWKLRASESSEEAKEHFPLGRGILRFVAAWLIWQSIYPLRHYAILGDGRFTYEGLSFSWRLKTDVHHCFGHQMIVHDPTIIKREATGRTRINWNQWHGDKVVYLSVAPGRINWPQLPEIVVLLQAPVGERVVYNPFAGSPTVRSEVEARERVSRIWQELYGRQPSSVSRTIPLSALLESASAELKAEGHDQDSAKLSGLVSRLKQLESTKAVPQESARTLRDVRGALNELTDPPKAAEKAALLLQSMDPFALEGEPRHSAPFLLIEDRSIFGESAEGPRRVDRNVWRNGPGTREARGSMVEHTGGEPLVVYIGGIGRESRNLMPQAYILDIQDVPDRRPYIRWNSWKDLTYSKFLHTSFQPFYLRRYARRVAGMWEKQYSRRPSVHAYTGVSLNGRPHQLLVDLGADLASVPAIWFIHNSWIKDLDTPRIPREELTNRAAYWIGAKEPSER